MSPSHDRHTAVPGASVTIRHARADDAQAITSIFCEAMPEAVSSVNVLGMTGGPAFVRDSIAAWEQDGDSEFWIADEEPVGAVGFVQLRHTRDTVLVNHFHVRPDRQSRGIGTKLLKHSLGHIVVENVALDVFDFSHVSRAMYQKLGFDLVAEYHWRILETESSRVPRFLVRNLPEAGVTHAAYDVSNIQLETRSGLHHVGRIGTRWFRVTSSGPLADDDFLPALARLDPRRDLLLITEASSDPSSEAPYLRSLRLGVSPDVLLQRLG